MHNGMLKAREIATLAMEGTPGPAEGLAWKGQSRVLHRTLPQPAQPAAVNSLAPKILSAWHRLHILRCQMLMRLWHQPH